MIKMGRGVANNHAPTRRTINQLNHPYSSITEQIAQTALTYDLHPIPLKYRDKSPHTQLIWKSTNQISWTHFVDTPPTPTMLSDWFRMPAVNLGIVMTSGIAVMDFDDPIAFAHWFIGHGKTLNLPMAKTARGVHVYFQHASPDQSTKVANADDQIIGDLKMTGYVVAPPSRHSTGRFYQWLASDIAAIRDVTHTIEEILGPLHQAKPSASQTYQTRSLSQSSPWEFDATPVTSLVDVMNTRGKYAHALCPLHDDTNVSFWINTDSNTWGCWACGYHHENAATLLELLDAVA